MKQFVLPTAMVLLLALSFGCKKKQCIDCHEPGTDHIFTFCDPPEPALDSLNCGNVYDG